MHIEKYTVLIESQDDTKYEVEGNGRIFTIEDLARMEDSIFRCLKCGITPIVVVFVPIKK